MHRLHGTIQNYAWGSPTAIPEILGLAVTGEPVAEYWLGAHASSPSHLDDGRALDAAIDADPEILGATSRARFGDRLPFLLKILAAAEPLSLQAHPTRGQAEEGFARENAAGIPIDDPRRTYKDDWPKPEMVLALTEYHALCGFRGPEETVAMFEALNLTRILAEITAPLSNRRGAAALAEVFIDVLRSDDHPEFLLETVAAAERHADDAGPVGDFARTALYLAKFHPGDPGVLVGLLMNHLVLQPGEAVHLPPGNLHCYLHGTGIEIMANSDNVVRGGLTPKHVDVDELVRVVSFDPAAPDVVTGTPVEAGLVEYAAGEPEFRLWHLDATQGAVRLPQDDAARIILCLDGELTADDGTRLRRGESALATAGETVVVSGGGSGVVASSGV